MAPERDHDDPVAVGRAARPPRAQSFAMAARTMSPWSSVIDDVPILATTTSAVGHRHQIPSGS